MSSDSKNAPKAPVLFCAGALQENQEKGEYEIAIKMNRPYIVCHMMTAIDGRIDCAMTTKLSGVNEYYETLGSRYKGQFALDRSDRQ